jgi:hypothetical protein
VIQTYCKAGNDGLKLISVTLHTGFCLMPGAGPPYAAFGFYEIEMLGLTGAGLIQGSVTNPVLAFLPWCLVG